MDLLCLRRKPAWTDRVLHKSSPFVSVDQKSYEAHPSITMSDHKPVSAEFLVDVGCFIRLSCSPDVFTCVDSIHRLGDPRPRRERPVQVQRDF